MLFYNEYIKQIQRCINIRIRFISRKSEIFKFLPLQKRLKYSTVCDKPYRKYHGMLIVMRFTLGVG